MNHSRTQLEDQLNLAVQRNGNQTVLFTNAISQQIGLSATEFECFSLLLDEGPFTAGQLADKCGLSTGGITGLVNRLVRAGFVTRSEDPTDRRRVIITAVHDQVIYQKLTALYAPISHAFTDMIQQYSDNELGVITNFLNRSNAMAADVLADMKQITE